MNSHILVVKEKKPRTVCRFKPRIKRAVFGTKEKTRKFEVDVSKPGETGLKLTEIL